MKPLLYDQGVTYGIAFMPAIILCRSCHLDSHDCLSATAAFGSTMTKVQIFICVLQSQADQVVRRVHTRSLKRAQSTREELSVRVAALQTNANHHRRKPARCVHRHLSVATLPAGIVARPSIVECHLLGRVGHNFSLGTISPHHLCCRETSGQERPHTVRLSGLRTLSALGTNLRPRYQLGSHLVYRVSRTGLLMYVCVSCLLSLSLCRSCSGARLH